MTPGVRNCVRHRMAFLPARPTSTTNPAENLPSPQADLRAGVVSTDVLEFGQTAPALDYREALKEAVTIGRGDRRADMEAEAAQQHERYMLPPSDSRGGG